jgi:hypothetical protein
LDTKNLTCCHEVAADQPSNQLTHAKILTLSHWTFSFQNGQCCQKEQAAQDSRGYICFLSCETLLGAKNQKSPHSLKTSPCCCISKTQANIHSRTNLLQIILQKTHLGIFASSVQKHKRPSFALPKATSNRTS